MRYFIKKIVSLIITLLLVSLLAFLAFQVIPGDAATAKLGGQATPEKLDALREEMGLTDPLFLRYVNWLKDFFSGSMGNSYTYDMTVRELLGSRISVTATLTAMSFILIVLISIPVGLFSSKKTNGIFSKILGVFNPIIMAIPPFFIGIILSGVFGLILKIFTPGAFVSFADSPSGYFIYLLFPAIAIALPKSAMTIKLLRSTIAGEMTQDYVRTAYSRGNSKRSVLYIHVLRNTLIPIVTFLSLTVADIVASSIVVEQVFSVTGLGRLLIASISNRDYPVAQAIIVIIAFVVISLNFLSDIIYQYVDPRVRLD